MLCYAIADHRRRSEGLDRVLDTNRAAFDDVGTQSPAMFESVFDAVDGGPAQVVARFTESHALADGLADAEPLADQMVEGGVAGRDIPAVLVEVDGDPRFAFDRLDRLGFRERDFPAAALDIGEGTDTLEVAIASKSLPGDGFHLVPGPHRCLRFGSGVNRHDRSCSVHTPTYETRDKNVPPRNAIERPFPRVITGGGQEPPKPRQTVSHDDSLVFEFTPDLDAAYTATDGESLTIETIDSLGGAVQDESTVIDEVPDEVNGATGPIAVEGPDRATSSRSRSRTSG